MVLPVAAIRENDPISRRQPLQNFYSIDGGSAHAHVNSLCVFAHIIQFVYGDFRIGANERWSANMQCVCDLSYVNDAFNL